MSPTLEAAHGEMTKVIVSSFSTTVTVTTGWEPGVPLEAPLMLNKTDDIPLLLRIDQPRTRSAPPRTIAGYKQRTRKSCLRSLAQAGPQFAISAVTER